MKKINWKNVIEKAKTIALIVIFTAAIAFYAGMKYQATQDAHVGQKVDEACLCSFCYIVINNPPYPGKLIVDPFSFIFD